MTRVDQFEVQIEHDIIAFGDATPEKAERYRHLMRRTTAYKLAELGDELERIACSIPGPVGWLVRRVVL